MILTILVAFSIPTYASAASGWQYQGTETFYMIGDKDVATNVYTAVDGYNFKLEIDGQISSDVVAVSMYVNGVYNLDSKASGLDSNGNATIILIYFLLVIIININL